MKKYAVIVLSVLLVLGLAGAVQAAPVGLSLVMDSSGSINGTNYQLQLQGYANAIVDATVVAQDGSVAINVIEFGQNAIQQIGWTVINSLADAQNLASAILGLNRTGINTGWTAIGDAISLADSLFGGQGFSKNIIDVTTDGANNFGTDPLTAAMAAVNTGNTTVVNALGIGTGVAPGFAFGPDSFSMVITDFAGFETAIRDKIRKEVPEPGTLLLLGTGLIGVVGLRRRRR